MSDVTRGDLLNSDFDYAEYDGVRLERFSLKIVLSFTDPQSRLFSLEIDGVPVEGARPELLALHLRTPALPSPHFVPSFKV